MKARCPYCGGPLNGIAALPQVSKRKLNIYQAVLAAGPLGIRSADLTRAMFSTEHIPKSGYGMMRVQLCELNKLLIPRGEMIRGKRRGTYRFCSTKRNRHG